MNGNMKIHCQIYIYIKFSSLWRKCLHLSHYLKCYFINMTSNEFSLNKNIHKYLLISLYLTSKITVLSDITLMSYTKCFCMSNI